jgi:hypothetical protein
MGGPGSGRGSGGDRGGRKPLGPNKRTLANAELVKRKGYKLPLEVMLEIAYDPNVPEERRDRFLLACASYLHSKPSTPMFASAIQREFLNGSTSLTGTAPFTSGAEAMDYLARKVAAQARHSDE